MSSPDHILAIDQGTSATKAVLVDAAGAIVARGAAPVPLLTPRPGWVEQDANAIWASVQAAVADCVTDQRVAAVGLSTQRESLLLWDRATGEPLGPMLSWQDQRTVADCARLREHDERGARDLRPAAGPDVLRHQGALAARRLRARERVPRHRGQLPGASSSAAATSSRPATPPARSCSTCAPATGRRSCSSCSASRARCCPTSSPRPGRSRPRAASPRCRTARRCAR